MMRNSRGFTLIELMITIAILGTLTVLTSESIQQAIKAKVKLQGQIDDVSRMRDAMRLIESDVHLAYHYRDIEKDIYTLVNKKTTASPGVVPTASAYGEWDPFSQSRQMPRRDPITQFVGTTDSVNFVTENNARTVKDTRQADYVEVGYSLKDCKSLGPDGGSSKCIWRRSTPIVDDDVTKGGDEVVLLENVSEFKLRYIGKGKQDWVSDWRTDEGGDGITKNNFPEAVEVSITVEKKVNGKNKKYSMQNIVPLHFPNNANSNGSTTNGVNSGSQNPWQQSAPATH
jgi:prepilin-type N-terminal cleavage/methylation domain-containing protein